MQKPLLLSLLISFAAAHSGKNNRIIEFPDLPGFKTLVCDLHMHTVFSDGSVWPNIRVMEANKDGLDVIATTEHIEYQSWISDIPHPDSCLLYTSPSPRDRQKSRMPSSA